VFGIVRQKKKPCRGGVEPSERTDPAPRGVPPGRPAEAVQDDLSPFGVGKTHEDAARLVEAEKKGGRRKKRPSIETKGGKIVDRRVGPNTGRSGERPVGLHPGTGAGETTFGDPPLNLAPGGNTRL